MGRIKRKCQKFHILQQVVPLVLKSYFIFLYEYMSSFMCVYMSLWLSSKFSSAVGDSLHGCRDPNSNRIQSKKKKVKDFN